VAPTEAPPAAPPAEAVARLEQGAAGSASFGVGLADREKAEGAATVDQPARRAQDGYASDERKQLRGGASDPAVAAPAKPSPSAKLSKKGSAGIELRSRDLQPKDLDDEQQDLARQDGDGDALGNGRVVAKNAPAAPKAEQAVRGPGGNAAPGGGAATPAPTTVPASPAPEPPRAQGAFKESPEVATATSGKAKAPAPAKTVARPPYAQKPLAPPPPPAAAAPAAPATESATLARDDDRAVDKSAADSKSAAKSAAKADDKPVEDKLLAWAAEQHRQVVALVSSNRCRDAATAAVAIYNRAPDYYASNVATDRAIKPCLAYVTTERERVDRSRSAKRATAVDSPAASPPPAQRK
jgi:hypothetical protein